MPQFQLTDPATQDRLEQTVADIVAADDVSEAVDLVRWLPQLLRLQRVTQQAPEIVGRYEELLVQLRWIAFSAISWNEALALVREHLTVALALHRAGSINLVEKMKTRLRSELFLEERDRYRSQLRGALLDNQEVLTDGQLEHNGKPVSPTVHQWLEEYVSAFGAKPAEELAYRDWMVKHEAFNRLDAEERADVATLFDFYEELKFSSLTPEGNEDVLFTSDEAGHLYQYREGGLEPIDPDGQVKRLIDEELARQRGVTPPAATPSAAPAATPLTSPTAVSPVAVTAPPPAPAAIPRDEIMRRYQGDPVVAEAIAARQQQLGSDSAKLTSQLRLLLEGSQPDQTEVIATLMALAVSGQLVVLLGRQDGLADVVEATLKRHQREADIRQFRLNPTAPRFLRTVLEGILEDRLRLPTDEAARIGLHVANALARAGQPQYHQLAYFDMGTQQFRWQA